MVSKRGHNREKKKLTLLLRRKGGEERVPITASRAKARL
jgi:hypothetical protein